MSNIHRLAARTGTVRNRFALLRLRDFALKSSRLTEWTRLDFSRISRGNRAILPSPVIGASLIMSFIASYSITNTAVRQVVRRHQSVKPASRS
jgi:hypothetical protein